MTIDLVPEPQLATSTSGSRRRWPPAPGSPERARYLFRDGRGPDGSEPPNNWPSVFGGPAWTPGARRAVVPAPLRAGAAGPGLHQPRGGRRPRGDDAVLAGPRRRRLPDRRRPRHGQARRACRTWCRWRTPACSTTTAPATCASTRTACTWCTGGSGRCSTSTPAPWPSARSGCPTTTRLAQYLRDDELQLAFNFKLLTAEWDADELRDAVTHSLATVADTPGPGLLGAVQPRPAAARDPLRRRASSGSGGPGRPRCCSWPCPGAVYLYNGDELGMPDVDLPDEALQDPIWERSGRTERGRDACRVPVPWSGTEPAVRVLDRAATPGCPCPTGWGGADRGGPGGRPVVDAVAVPSGARAAARRPRRSAARSWSGCRRRTGASRSAARRAGVPGEPLRRGGAAAGGAGAAGQRRRRRRHLPADAAVWLKA